MEYSEEEKKAIEYLKEHINYFKKQIEFIEAIDCDYYDEEYEIYKNRIKQFETILNILEKQQKEIVELNNKYVCEKVAKEEAEELLENSIPKEAIREKIEELEKDNKYYMYGESGIKYQLLKELLGE